MSTSSIDWELVKTLREKTIKLLRELKETEKAAKKAAEANQAKYQEFQDAKLALEQAMYADTIPEDEKPKAPKREPKKIKDLKVQINGEDLEVNNN